MFTKHKSSFVQYCFYFNLRKKNIQFSTPTLSYEIEIKLKCGEKNFFSEKKNYQ